VKRYGKKTVSGKSEIATLKRHFKIFDIDDSGSVIYQEFVGALRRLGVVLDPAVSQALFNKFDRNNNGRISYDEFSAALYGANAGISDSKNIPPSVGPGTQYLDSSSMMVSAEGASTQVPSVVKVVFLMGGPCSGKTTQASRIAREFSFVHIDVAYLLQVEAENGQSPEADAVRDALSDGLAINPNVTVALIKNAIEANVAQGKTLFVLDGFPRGRDNIVAWQRACSEYDVPVALFLDVPMEVLEGRVNANHPPSPAVTQRLQVYQQMTIPLLSYFADARKLASVSGIPAAEHVYEQVRKVIRSL
jgi:UMP-CMP kinase